MCGKTTTARIKGEERLRNKKEKRGSSQQRRPHRPLKRGQSFAKRLHPHQRDAPSQQKKRSKTGDCPRRGKEKPHLLTQKEHKNWSGEVADISQMVSGLSR